MAMSVLIWENHCIFAGRQTKIRNMRRSAHLLFYIFFFLFLTGCQEHGPESGMVLSVPGNFAGTVSGETSLTFSWDPVEGASQYYASLTNAYDETSVGDPVFVTESSVTFEGLEKGFSYVCRVRAIGGMEYSEFLVSDAVYLPDPEYESFNMPASEDEHGLTLAFPGAEGGGMHVTGGRGGAVIHVTNTNDSGEGSLREALNTSGSRTVVFDVAGRIDLQSELRISEGDLTIAGQTAPGQGICISGYPVAVDADNVIIRFLRFRLGDVNAASAAVTDTLASVYGHYRDGIIIDHCSMSWGLDGCASFYANTDFTMQWCMVYEALNNPVSSAGAGLHGMGGIWGGKNASFHHNLLGHNGNGSPRLDCPDMYGDHLSTHRGNVDIRNNVIYNWGSNSMYGGEDGSFNVIDNYFKPGPASEEAAWFVDAWWYSPEYSSGTDYPDIYVSGNWHSGSYASAINSDNSQGVVWRDQSQYGQNPSHSLQTEPFKILADDATACYMTAHSAEDAFTAVTGYAGASLVRDNADKRVTSEAMNANSSTSGSNGSTGGLIDSQTDAGGWQEYSATSDELTAVTDTDGDGMPDAFETEYSLDPSNASDASSKTLDNHGRYTNLEMYLHWLVRDIVSAQGSNGTYTEL